VSDAEDLRDLNHRTGFQLKFNGGLNSVFPSAQKELVACWCETGHVLEKQRRAELAAQSPAQSRLAAFDMLQLGGMLPVDPAREQRSGLIEMQRLFVRGHGCGQIG